MLIALLYRVLYVKDELGREAVTMETRVNQENLVNGDESCVSFGNWLAVG